MDTRIAPFVEAARAYIRRALSVELDVSPESLAYVDHYVRSTRADRDAKLDDDVLRLAAAALGAYFGEVLIAAFGGAWNISTQDEAHPERWKLELNPPSLSMQPTALAAFALAGGEIAGYDDHIAPPFRDAAALEQLLESSAPIDAELYFSLTGRFEAIAQMRELLAEIDRRRQAGPPTSEPGGEEEELN